MLVLSGSVFRFGVGPQHLGPDPGLGDAAPARMRRLRVEHLADRAHPFFLQMVFESVQYFPGATAVVGMDAKPAVDELPD